VYQQPIIVSQNSLVFPLSLTRIRSWSFETFGKRLDKYYPYNINYHGQVHDIKIEGHRVYIEARECLLPIFSVRGMTERKRKEKNEKKKKSTNERTLFHI
jgi:hypothetical protein